MGLELTYGIESMINRFIFACFIQHVTVPLSHARGDKLQSCASFYQTCIIEHSTYHFYFIRAPATKSLVTIFNELYSAKIKYAVFNVFFDIS